jgi:hypothetical protein
METLPNTSTGYTTLNAGTFYPQPPILLKTKQEESRKTDPASCSRADRYPTASFFEYRGADKAFEVAY